MQVFTDLEQGSEAWRPVVGFEGYYEVSSKGNVRSVDRILSHGRSRRGKSLSLKTSKSGHKNIRLCKSGRHHWKWVHRLVLEAFVGSCPDGYLGCHSNGISGDNRLENLRWDTPQANEADKELHGTIMRGAANGMSRLSDAKVSEIRRRLSQGCLGKHLAAEFGVTAANISSIAQMKTWRHVQ